MDNLAKYIYEAPLCEGLDGKGCSDYLARKDDPKSEKRQYFPNRHRAILVDYRTKKLYYDSLCESCSFKNETEYVIERIRKNGIFKFNPKESISFTSRISNSRIGKFSKFATKKYCDNYIRLHAEQRKAIEEIMIPEKLEVRKNRFKVKDKDITPKVNPQTREEIELNIAYMEGALARMRENK